MWRRREVEPVMASGFGGDGSRVFFPDERLRDHHSYCLRALRGVSAYVVAYDMDHKPCGWVHVDDIAGGPFADVKDWMARTGYRDEQFGEVSS